MISSVTSSEFSPFYAFADSLVYYRGEFYEYEAWRPDKITWAWCTTEDGSRDFGVDVFVMTGLRAPFFGQNAMIFLSGLTGGPDIRLGHMIAEIDGNAVVQQLHCRLDRERIPQSFQAFFVSRE